MQSFCSECDEEFLKTRTEWADVFQTLEGDDAVPPESIACLRGYAAAEAAEIAEPDYEGDGEQRICEQCAKTELQDGAWN